MIHNKYKTCDYKTYKIMIINEFTLINTFHFQFNSYMRNINTVAVKKIAIPALLRLKGGGCNLFDCHCNHDSMI